MDQAIVDRDLQPHVADEEDSDDEDGPDLRPDLLSWALQILTVHGTFRGAFLPGTLSTPERRCSAHLWMLNEQGAAFSRMFKELIAAFVGGVETGRRLRNVREFAEELAMTMEDDEVEAEENMKGAEEVEDEDDAGNGELAAEDVEMEIQKKRRFS